MKFSLKVALALFLISLFTAFSSVKAQSITANEIVSPTTVKLNSVCIVNNLTNTNSSLKSLEAWAVGDSGTIIHWNGTRWSSVTSPTSVNLYSVIFINSSYGWAVGGSANNGIILQFNNTWKVWNTISFSGNASGTDTINSTLYSITTNVAGDVGWTVGAGGIALGWNGAAWFGFTDVSTNTLRGVSMIHDSNDAWAAGDNGTIVHWNGATWSSMTSPTTANLNSIVIVNGTNGWAVGGIDNDLGIIIHLTGTTWTVWDSVNFGGTTNSTTGYVTDIINATLYSMTMDTASSAWAVGGKGTVLYWTGTEWDAQMNVIPNTLRGVAMIHDAPQGSIEAWAVGDNGTILAWNGTQWVPELSIMVIPLLMSIVLAAALLRKSRLNRKVNI